MATSQAEAKTSQAENQHASAANKLDNASCLACHDGQKKEIKVTGAEGKMRPLNVIDDSKYAQSVHSKMQCVACHKEITDSSGPHKKNSVKKVGCVECHQDLWATAQKENKTKEKPRLGKYRSVQNFIPRASKSG